MKPSRKDWYVEEFTSISKGIRNKNHLSYEDFLRVKNYKAQALSEAKKGQVMVQTKKAFEAAKQHKVEDAIKALTKLHGVGIATASAILAMWDPDKYAIVDKRVIKNLGVSFRKNPLKSAEGYKEYLRVMDKKRGNATLRDFERKVFEKED